MSGAASCSRKWGGRKPCRHRPNTRVETLFRRTNAQRRRQPITFGEHALLSPFRSESVYRKASAQVCPRKSESGTDSRRVDGKEG